MYQLTGSIVLDDGLELVNPRFESGKVTYDRFRDKAIIEVLFYITSTEQQTFTHSRVYELDCAESWDKSDALNAFLRIFERYTYTVV